MEDVLQQPSLCLLQSMAKIGNMPSPAAKLIKPSATSSIQGFTTFLRTSIRTSISQFSLTPFSKMKGRVASHSLAADDRLHYDVEKEIHGHHDGHLLDVVGHKTVVTSVDFLSLREVLPVADSLRNL